MKLPENLTIDRVMEAANETTFGLENKGFCLACGEEHDGCEPDARNYPCEACEKNMVFGAEEIVMMFA